MHHGLVLPPVRDFGLSNHKRLKRVHIERDLPSDRLTGVVRNGHDNDFGRDPSRTLTTKPPILSERSSVTRHTITLNILAHKTKSFATPRTNKPPFTLLTSGRVIYRKSRDGELQPVPDCH